MKASMMYLLLIVIIIILSFTYVFAQAPEAAWFRTYGNGSAALSLHEMPDSGFVLGGYTKPEGDAYRDMYIVRTGSDGDTLWTNTIGQSGRHESASCLYPATDGGFILAGTIGEEAPYSSYSDLYLVKTDQDGEFEWHSRFGSEGKSESGVSVVPTVDGGYLVAGYFWDASTVYDTWLLKTSNLGVLGWQDQLTWADADYPTCVNLTPDSGYVVTGYTQSFDEQYDYDMFILKLDKLGLGTWSDAYGSAYPYDEAANHVCHTSDGGYLLCGYRKDESTPKDIYVVKTDAIGGVEWTSQLGGTYHDEARCCIETVDGGYAVSASWHRDGNWKVGLIKYSADGDTMWTAFYGDSARSFTPYGLVQTADNGYAVAGLMFEDSTSAFLVKFEGEPGIDPFTYRVTDLNVGVDDTAPALDTIQVDISKKELAGRSVVGVRVTIDTLNHPAVDELTVTLTHNGTEVNLVDQGDASGANFIGTVLSDASAAFLGGGPAPYTGSFRPHERLGAFIDSDPNGDWIIRVNDGVPGNDGFLKAWGITLLTDIELDVDDSENGRLLPEYSLSQCYPNPFNPTTTIDFALSGRADVTLEIFNILGHKVITLIDDNLGAGYHSVTWNGVDQGGFDVASGVYFYRIKAGDFIESKNMLLLK